MPSAPARACPRCFAIIRQAGPCAGCARRIEQRRGSAHARGYNRRWSKARAAYLSEQANALCVLCLPQGVTSAATVVDHIIPHEGDTRLFWDRSNWQPLCVRCHGIKTAMETQQKRVSPPGYGVGAGQKSRVFGSGDRVGPSRTRARIQKS